MSSCFQNFVCFKASRCHCHLLVGALVVQSYSQRDCIGSTYSIHSRERDDKVMKLMDALCGHVKSVFVFGGVVDLVWRGPAMSIFMCLESIDTFILLEINGICVVHVIAIVVWYIGDPLPSCAFSMGGDFSGHFLSIFA
ncbi:hypothetical protein VNO78_14979 [Psophocarpus tetragonolobus]|uniref:Uncharacterized protein n=1 Tax=Psophocarpus tetragonolobus TaxID=3891 RepID=A0AAN9XJF5_PSOTE